MQEKNLKNLNSHKGTKAQRIENQTATILSEFPSCPSSNNSLYPD